MPGCPFLTWGRAQRHYTIFLQAGACLAALGHWKCKALNTQTALLLPPWQLLEGLLAPGCLPEGQLFPELLSAYSPLLCVSGFLPDGSLKLPPVALATPRESTPCVASSLCSCCISEPTSAMDDGGDSRRDLAQGSDSKEYCLSDRDIVEVVRTEYVYTRPPPWSDTLPTIHVITPTYSRPVQKAELTRLANTLLHVPNLHWILVEDSQRRTPLVTRLLRDTGLNYTHLNVETPRNYKLRGDMRDPRIPRGTMQRNLALRWLRETFNKNSSQPGIVYFADDDNTYSLELFEEMRTTRKVSVWPVAFVGGLRYESPKVNAAGKVYGWKTVFDPHRPFAIDMAGFAVNLRLILQRSQAYFKLRGVKGGYQESSLLRELVTLNDLEPKAANCTKILVWHTRTEKPVLVNEGKKGFTDPNVEI
ncbi:galactosylgalactosylxylosylprotein 3-beta-glucuronosyltransferase 1 isoform X3 [Malaclemys terrapin pileata]|nr:galactosylgalactosylxylosylprotein 3-beta-glucuronosyltransferase 1 isoform X3 [Malaclemys terrapin pileata]